MRLKLGIGGLVLALYGGAAQGDELYGDRSAVTLGRLFLTAEQRRSLDQQRRLVPQKREASDEESPTPTPSSTKKTASFGLISSGDRAPLIWRDGGFRVASQKSTATETREPTDEKESLGDESAE
ncbi:MAG: hypothetical protein AAF417_17130 [Pseudomonadota bacterium]